MKSCDTETCGLSEIKISGHVAIIIIQPGNFGNNYGRVQYAKSTIAAKLYKVESSCKRMESREMKGWG